MPCADKCFACATEQEIMVDLMMSTTSAFSDRPSQPSCQSCRLALHPASAGLQRPHWLITLSESSATVSGLSRFFDPLGETVRGPTQTEQTSAKYGTPNQAPTSGRLCAYVGVPKTF